VAANFAMLLRGPRCTINIKHERTGTSAHMPGFVEFTRRGVVQVVQTIRVEDDGFTWEPVRECLPN
jgi:hypothetical protein